MAFESNWRIELGRDSLFLMVDGQIFKGRSVAPVGTLDPSNLTFTSNNDQGKVFMQLFEEPCTKKDDGNNYAYRIELEFTAGKEKNPTKLSGCGFFIPNPKLQGKYQIIEVMGKALTNDRALISFDVYSQKISGNNSCNQINGHFTFGFESLHFGKMQTTLMACQDAPLENLVNEVFSKSNVRYQFDEHLVLYDGDEKIMILQPIND